MPELNSELLLQILNELKKLNNPQPLGLLESGIKIYCNRRNAPYLWYRIASDRQTVIGIEQTAIRGYVKDLKIEDRERRGKEVPKLLLRLQADKSYWLESGVDSNFTKGLLAAISSLSPEELQEPITIAVKAGDDDESVLFCRVYTAQGLVFQPYNGSTEWEVVTQIAIDNVKAANKGLDSQEVEPEPVASTATIDRTTVYEAIGAQIERLGWDAEQGKKHLRATYKKSGRSQLSDDQLIEFFEFLSCEAPLHKVEN